MAQAAMAISNSRPRGRLSFRYSSAATSASAGPNGTASEAGNNASWSAISSAERGPLRHSKRTRQLNESLSPSRMSSRRRGADLLVPVRASINADVSKWIMPAAFPCLPFCGELEGPQFRHRLPLVFECSAATPFDPPHQAGADVPRRRVALLVLHNPEWPREPPRFEASSGVRLCGGAC